MSEDHIERLRKLEEAYDAKQHNRKEAELRERERMAQEASAKAEFMRSVVMPAFIKAGDEMSTIGWIFNPAHESQQHKDGSTVIATLARKSWSATIDFIWTTATHLSLEAHWGLPDRRNQRPLAGMPTRNKLASFDITTATAEQVRTAILDTIINLTEKNTKNSF